MHCSLLNDKKPEAVSFSLICIEVFHSSTSKTLARSPSSPRLRFVAPERSNAYEGSAVPSDMTP